jgi:hypothetical protein
MVSYKKKLESVKENSRALEAEEGRRKDPSICGEHPPLLLGVAGAKSDLCHTVPVPPAQYRPMQKKTTGTPNDEQFINWCGDRDESAYDSDIIKLVIVLSGTFSAIRTTTFLKKRVRRDDQIENRHIPRFCFYTFPSCKLSSSSLRSYHIWPFPPHIRHTFSLYIWKDNRAES